MEKLIIPLIQAGLGILFVYYGLGKVWFGGKNKEQIFSALPITHPKFTATVVGLLELLFGLFLILDFQVLISSIILSCIIVIAIVVKIIDKNYLPASMIFYTSLLTGLILITIFNLQ